MAVTAAECLKDEFDQRGVPDELLQAFQEQETASMSHRAANSRMGASMREQVLALVQCFLDEVYGQIDVWFEVVRLLDGTSLWPSVEGPPAEPCSAASPEVQTARVAALSLAAFAPAGEGPEVKTLCCWPLKRLALSASSVSVRFGGGAVPAGAIVREKHSLLLELDAAPSVHRWLLAFVARLDAALRQTFSPALEHLGRISIQLAALLLHLAPAHENRPPRSIAAGAFATVLVYAGVLPVGYLLPSGADEWKWGAALQTMRRRLPPRTREDCEAQSLSELREVKRRFVLARLSLATDSHSCTIRGHVHEALDMLVGVPISGQQQESISSY